MRITIAIGMSYTKYKTAQASTETPRQTEYRVFAEVTRSLLDCRAQERVDASFFSAIDRNRRLWLTLQMDLASEDNRFPDDLKAQIISLAIWVDKHSSLVLRGNATVDSLIVVNRAMMEGLASMPAPAVAAAAPANA